MLFSCCYRESVHSHDSESDIIEKCSYNKSIAIEGERNERQQKGARDRAHFLGQRGDGRWQHSSLFHNPQCRRQMLLPALFKRFQLVSFVSGKELEGILSLSF